LQIKWDYRKKQKKMWAECLENVGPSTSHNPLGLYGMLQGLLYFTLLYFTLRNSDRLWSIGQSSWLQIQRPSFDFRCYQIFWEVGLKRGPLSLMTTSEELLERKSSGSGLELREYGRMDPSRCPRDILYPQKLALTSPASGGRSVGIVIWQTQVTEFSYLNS
jgi:hypothetical protein